MINGIIPYALIDGCGAPVLDGHDPTKLHNTVTLVEIKDLGTINGETMQQCAERIENDIVRYAEALDAKYPGSKVLEEKNRTARALELRAANPDELFNMHRRFLISSFGLFAARLWARYIHDRFRDAVSAQAPSYVLQLPNPDREVIRAFHLGNSHPRRAQHRGYCRGA